MIDNRNPKDREVLIKTLQAQGLDAFEWESLEGIDHVCVPILATFEDTPITINTTTKEMREKVEEALGDTPYEAYLYIATNSRDYPCEVGVMGTYPDGRRQFASNDWTPVETLDEATGKFLELWRERNDWLQAYLNGMETRR